MIQQRQLPIMQKHRYSSARLLHLQMHLALISVVTQKEGVPEKYLFLPANPNLVSYGHDIIVKSPVRLTAGMGDALANLFSRPEPASEAVLTSCAGGKTTEAAMALAGFANTLMEEGVKAKIALEAGAAPCS